MKLHDYLREKIYTHFNPLVIKDKCEYCGSIENLHVHHCYPFVQMLQDTLEELNLELKDTKEYTVVELLNIKEKILGKHLNYTYKTLCSECHLGVEHRKYKKFEKLTFSIDENLLDKWLTKETIVEFVITKNNMRNKDGRPIGLRALPNELEKHGFTIESTRKTFNKKKITVYKITKIQ